LYNSSKWFDKMEALSTSTEFFEISSKNLYKIEGFTVR